MTHTPPHTKHTPYTYTPPPHTQGDIDEREFLHTDHGGLASPRAMPGAAIHNMPSAEFAGAGGSGGGSGGGGGGRDDSMGAATGAKPGGGAMGGAVNGVHHFSSGSGGGGGISSIQGQLGPAQMAAAAAAAAASAGGGGGSSQRGGGGMMMCTGGEQPLSPLAALADAAAASDLHLHFAAPAHPQPPPQKPPLGPSGFKSRGAGGGGGGGGGGGFVLQGLQSPLPIMGLGPPGPATPISQAMGSVAWLRGLVKSMGEGPSPGLQRYMEAAGPDAGMYVSGLLCMSHVMLHTCLFHM